MNQEIQRIISDFIKNNSSVRDQIVAVGYQCLQLNKAGDYKVDEQWRILEPGMVLTIEPGLYIPADCSSVDPCWRGIGIRIEDDVLVTENGYRVLGKKIPKTIDEVEDMSSG